MKHIKIYEDFLNEQFVKESTFNSPSAQESAKGINEGTNKALVDESKINDPEVEKKLEDKSKNSGIPIGILRTLMRRGMEKYQSSSPHSNRWNATEKEYGYARVDSFIKKDKSTWGSADSDLANSQ
jgi:hypothetical protein